MLSFWEPNWAMTAQEGTTGMAQFERYIGIDYSGAQIPESSCKGLRVCVAEGSSTPEPVQPPPSPRRYWTRRGLAEWLCNELGGETPTIVGIDHAFSFPLAYFERYRLSVSEWSSPLAFQWSVGRRCGHGTYRRFR